MPALDPLIVDLIANDKLTKQTQVASIAFERQSQRMEGVSDQLRRRIELNSSASGVAIKRFAASIAGYFTGRELIGITDSFTRFQNSLRVTGLEGTALKQVQDRLFESAQRFGVPLESLATLYSRASQAAEELGVSQEQLLKFTDNISAAIRVQGGSVEQASGALLQLSQAMAAGVVRSEEYNSLAEGLFPVLQAAAAGSDRFGGSVAKLRAEVLAGTVTSREFFAAIENGSDLIQKRAANATLTTAAAFTTLQNALVVSVGGAAQATGAATALAEGISVLADNIDTIIPAIAVLGTALGVGYVGNALAAARASRTAGASILAAFGGGTGLAVTALVAAVASYGLEAQNTTRLIEESRQATEAYRKSLENTGDAARTAASGQAGVGDQSAAAVPKLDSFAGATGRAADQLYRLADAQRKAAIEGLQAEKTAADSRLNALAARSPSGRALTRENNRAALGRGDVLGVSLAPAYADLRNLFSGGRSDREIAKAIQETIAERNRASKRIAEIEARPLESFIPPAGATAPGATGKATKGAKGRAGSDPAREAERAREVQDRISAEIASAQIAYVQELSQTTQNAAERADLERQSVDLTRQANEQDIKRDERLNAAQRDELIAVNARVATLRKQQIDQQEAERLRAQTLSIIQTAMRDEDAMLQLQSRLATSIEQRRKIELRRLDLAYDMERASIAEELASATIASDMGRIAAAVKRMADIQERKAVDITLTKRENDGPYAAYRRRLDELDIDEQLDAIKVDALRGLEQELVDSTTAALGLKGALGDIVGELVRVGLQRKLLGPIADQLFGPADGSSGGALGSLFSSIAGALRGGPGRASGGYVGAGQLVRVNEGASPGNVEGFRPSGGGSIIPLGRMNAVPAAGGGNSTLKVEISLNDRLLDARVMGTVGPAIVESIKQSVEPIANAAMYKTINEMTRKRM